MLEKQPVRGFPVSSRLCILVALTAGCQGGQVPPAAAIELSALGANPVDLPGLHNVCCITDKLISGGCPEGDDGFATLHRLQVRTVISVDGARPDVERARKVGLRYVHLPIGYDGVPREQALRLTRAVRDLPGLVYIHCHHGKHRGPAAAVAVRRCLDESCTAEAAVAELKRAGTAANYTGLYAAAGQFALVPAQELDQVPSDFPEVAPVAKLVELMVGVDERWEHLKQIRAAGWRTPASHADLDPPHEALLLREAYREAVRLEDVRQRSGELREWFVEAEATAGALESALRGVNEKGSAGATAAENAYRRAADACTRCHSKYRDLPSK